MQSICCHARARFPDPCRVLWTWHWIALLFLGITFRSEAVEPPPNDVPYFVESWGMEKGLPEDTVTAVVQTRDGYLWIGTEGGLARFDGMRFVTFRSTNTPGLPNHSVLSLFEDHSGMLWIGTEEGLCRYYNGRFERVGLRETAINSICEDHAGTLWLATESAGIVCYRHAGFQSMADEPAMPNKVALSVFTDAAGQVWMGFARSKWLVRYGNGKFETIAAAGTDDIYSMAESPRGTIWLGTQNGLVRMKNDRHKRYGTDDKIAGKKVTQLYASPEGMLWVASSGLQRIWRGDIRTLDDVSMRPAKVFRGICKDREGNLWVGTTGEGLVRLQLPRFQMLTMEAKESTLGLRTVMEDENGIMWLAQGSRGVIKIQPPWKVSVLPPVSPQKEDEVLGVYSSRNHDLWVATRGALQIWNDEGIRKFPELTAVRALYEDPQGRMWFGGTSGGITRWEKGVMSKLRLPSAVAKSNAHSFSQNSTGDMYVGTWEHGVLKIGADGKVTIYDTKSGFPTNHVRFVYVDHDDNVWFGSVGSGLGLLSKEGEVLFPNWTSEVLDEHIASIVEDDSGNIWMAAPRGVFMVPRTELLAAMRGKMRVNHMRVVNVMDGVRHGITEMACFPSIWKAPNGKLWFAAKKGLLIVDSRRLGLHAEPPPVHIERVLANGSPLPVTGELELAAGTRELTIEYTGLSFAAPGRVRFQYRLLGWDKDWVDAEDRRFAYYSNLAPGRYQFQVVAANADGIWNDQGSTLMLVQNAHFYQTAWAICLFAAVLGGGVIGAHCWRLAALKRERVRLERGIAERTWQLSIAKEQAEASTRAKTEFLENISHEIRNPLNGIIGLVTMLREATLGVRERELAHSLSACAKALGRVFGEVLNFSKLEHGHVEVREKPFSLDTLVEETVAVFRTTARQSGCEITMRRIGEPLDRFLGDDEKIESILGNFLSNALKHAPGSPVEILVQCESVDDSGATVTWNVTDCGAGIPPDEQELVFQKFVRGSAAKQQRAPGTGLGLATCRALAELLGGHVAVESEPGNGTTFFLMLRLKRDRNPVPLELPEMAATTADRALIVEDQAYNQIVVRRIAERLGFISDVASDAADVWEKMKHHAYSVVFLDWELPGTKGGEISRTIRGLPNGQDMIIIATTAHDSEEIRRECYAAGMDGFALKPFESETIARILKEAGAHRGRDGAESTRFDLRVFDFVGYDDPEQTSQAAQLYLDILEQELEKLTSAVDEGDLSSAAQAAHRLKSHAGLVDAADLREAADRIQRQAVTASVETLGGLHGELMRHAMVLRKRLSSWRTGDAIVQSLSQPHNGSTQECYESRASS